MLDTQIEQSISRDSDANRLESGERVVGYILKSPSHFTKILPLEAKQNYQDARCTKTRT